MKQKSLFIVLLGGKAKSSNIELHDIRWVIGNTINDTYIQLRNEWFGEKAGLHIDSYKRIEYIDGYKICINKSKSISKKQKPNKDSLWFVNLGGYNPFEMYEQHNAGLYVAKNAIEAKIKAKKNWVASLQNKHNDDCANIDNCHLIDKLNDWVITLRKDPKNRSQQMVPDWFGYKRIDKDI